MRFATSLALFLVAFSYGTCLSDTRPVSGANYELAARWTPRKAGKLVFDSAVQPHWLELSDRFWYAYETSEGRRFYLVDPKARSRKPLFDNAKLAAQLTKITLFPYDAQHLPIRTVKFIKKETALQFEIELPTDADIRDGDKVRRVKELGEETKTQEKTQDDMQEKKKITTTPPPKTPDPKTKTLVFEYDLASETATLLPNEKPKPKKPAWASVSPDEQTIVFARGHNLFMMDAANYALAQKKADDKNIKETQLTTDGEEYNSYAVTLKDAQKKEFQNNEKDRKDFRVPADGIVWSKDSKKIALVRDDQRKVAPLWVINSLTEPRPTLETYKYDMPGEENITQNELITIDLATKAKIKIKADRFKDQSLALCTDRIRSLDREQEKVTPKWLSDTSDRLFFYRSSRDRHKLDVCVANPDTGEVKTLIEERLNTYIETEPLRLVGGKEMLFWSERDGWGHYYLFDENGKLKNQVTSGEFVCRGIEGIDEKSRTIFFEACGREPGEDPYFTHLYRVGLDGKNLKLLDPGDAMHNATMNDAAKFFVDNASRVDSAPTSCLCDANGNRLLDLEAADLSALMEAGFKFPEPFRVKADDNVTDLFGVMYKPFDFNPRNRYPVILYVYPGPQTEAVSKTFSPRSQSMALAQYGFIVVEVGNRGGNPQRSKWYHNYGYGNLRDYGLADKKRAVEQLALKYPWIDIDRVGIFGHSGGGFMSTAAMLVYPDFFKVAVSSSGNHENNIYNRWWSETHHGVKEVTEKDGSVKFEYSIEKNTDLAKNLKGHLLLVTGDIDDNVHPANTIRMAAALIRANKRFDFMLMPGQRHGYGEMTDYFTQIRADYFCRHLLNAADTSVDITELNRDKEQSGTKRSR